MNNLSVLRYLAVEAVMSCSDEDLLDLVGKIFAFCPEVAADAG